MQRLKLRVATHLCWQWAEECRLSSAATVSNFRWALKFGVRRAGRSQKVEVFRRLNQKISTAEIITTILPPSDKGLSMSDRRNSLLDMLERNQRGWGSLTVAPEIASIDDAGNLYDFSGNVVQSWGRTEAAPQTWGELALGVATAPAKMATGVVDSFSPYDFLGDDGWRIPPAVSAFADAATATGRVVNGEMSPEEMPGEALNLASVMMGGGLAAPRPRGSVGVSGTQATNASKNAMIQHQNKAGYDAPKLEQRPFSSDYGKRDVGPAGSRLQVDIEGRPLTASFVAGRRRVGEGDEPLSVGQIDEIAQSLASSVRRVPKANLPRNAVGSYDARSTAISVLDELDPEDFSRTLAHELGHGIDFSGWGPANIDGIQLDGIKTGARKFYHDLATGDTEVNTPKKWRGPESYGYRGVENVRRELNAEMLRADMTDPNYFKTIHPQGAARIRAFVNTNPLLNNTIQFNANANPYLGLLPAAESDQRRNAFSK